jgi:hypothetical protein
MINYQILSFSQKFYQLKGFQIIDAPWYITKSIDEITKPSDRESIITNFGDCLPASGEQSFLAIWDQLEDGGKYQTITPCYRRELVEDEWHLPHFMKNELIIKGGQDKDVIWIAKACQQFFEIYSKKQVDLKLTDEGIDLEIDGIEIGSYGLRVFNDMQWVYGTGCAEPRFSKLMNKKL